jgi:hypothetical protein
VANPAGWTPLGPCPSHEVSADVPDRDPLLPRPVEQGASVRQPRPHGPGLAGCVLEGDPGPGSYISDERSDQGEPVGAGHDSDPGHVVALGWQYGRGLVLARVGKVRKDQIVGAFRQPSLGFEADLEPEPLGVFAGAPARPRRAGRLPAPTAPGRAGRSQVGACGTCTSPGCREGARVGHAAPRNRGTARRPWARARGQDEGEDPSRLRPRPRRESAPPPRRRPGSRQTRASWRLPRALRTQ